MSTLDDHLTEALAGRVLERIVARRAGHCLQVPHVPQRLADAACRLVQRGLTAPDFACVVTANPSKPWHSSPAKVVELRNASEDSGAKLVVFVPAGQNLAVEDSFGRSTFEVLDVLDIHVTVVDGLRRQLQRVAPDLADRVEDVAAIVRRDERFSVTDRHVASFMAAAAERPSEQGVALAMTELGLLPDERVTMADSDELPVRLARNLQQMDVLTDSAPPMDRVQRLGANGSDSFPDVAQVLVDALGDGTTDRHELANRLASSRTPDKFAALISEVGARPRVDELAILSLSGDFETGSEPPTLTRTNSTVKARYRCRPSAASVAGLHELRLELLSVTDQGREIGTTGVLRRSNAGSHSRRTPTAPGASSWILRCSTQVCTSLDSVPTTRTTSLSRRHRVNDSRSSRNWNPFLRNRFPFRASRPPERWPT